MDDLLGFSSNPARPAHASSSSSSFRYDDMFDSFYEPPPAAKPSSAPSDPVFDKPVFDDDGGDATFDNIFAHSVAPPKPSAPRVEAEKEEEDYLESLGRKTSGGMNTVPGLGESQDDGDLIPGFGGSGRRSGDPLGAKQQKDDTVSADIKTSMQADPFVVLESTSSSTYSSSRVFADPLDSLGRSTSHASEKMDIPSSRGFFEDADAFDSFPKFGLSASVGQKNQQKEDKPLNGGNQTTRTPAETFGSILPEEHTDKLYDTYSSFGRQKSETSRVYNVNVMEDSPKGNFGVSDDAWLTVSDIPLFTQPTAAPPPSRPPPPLKTRQTRLQSNSIGKNTIDVTRSGNSFSYNMDSSQKIGASQLDELEDFASSKSQRFTNGFTEVWSDEEKQTRSYTDSEQVHYEHDEVQKKEEMQRKLEVEKEREQASEQQRVREAEERIKIEKELEMERERERGKQAVEKAVREARERAAAEARAQAEKEARQRAERALAQKVAAEARERAAVEARERAAKAAAEAREKAASEARERAAKAAAEVRERAAADARERAAKLAASEARERAAAEARERVVAEARERAANEARAKAERDAVQKAAADARRRAERAAVERVAAEARERAAAEAREKAAAAAREKQQQQQQQQHQRGDDLDSFFGGSRANSAPKQRDPPKFSQDSSFGAQPQSRTPSAGVKRSTSAQASSTNNPFDDLSSIFGASSSTEEFQEIDGETEERRKARLERHQRTLERAAKALAAKNERDLQMLQEQEERHRIAESLDFEIKRWAAGKEGNLRALLSTLQYILWPQSGWRPVSLTDLITGAAVKKEYRKATLCIHPDKVQQKGATLQQKYIAEKVFDILKEAWNKFNSEELF